MHVDEGSSRFKVVDLFSGCGGFSLGAHHAGFEVVAAVDNDDVLASSYQFNFPKTKMIFKDICDITGDGLKGVAKGLVDGIIGGPPCQGFSDIGKQHPADPRSHLLKEFFRIVREANPSFFVMENVRGLAYTNARGVLDAALKLVVDDYSIFGPVLLNAADFGAATKRSRLFIVGLHKDKGLGLSIELFADWKRSAASVRAAISDMEGAVRIPSEDGFDTWRITKRGRPFNYARTLRTPNNLFTGHRRTRHGKEVVARFKTVDQGSVDPVGRHPRLAWDGQCPALRAGTGPDKGSYQSIRPIHPEYPRVITVREAARLQGFPDRHRFHTTVWHSFRMIGNSVSPIMAKVLLDVIRARISA